MGDSDTQSSPRVPWQLLFEQAEDLMNTPTTSEGGNTNKGFNQDVESQEGRTPEVPGHEGGRLQERGGRGSVSFSERVGPENVRNQEGTGPGQGLQRSKDVADKEKPRWMDLFDRGSHRQYQMEYLRDKHYEEILRTLRRSFSAEEASQVKEAGSSDDDDDDDDSESWRQRLGLPPVGAPPPWCVQVPAEQYFLTPDPALMAMSGPFPLDSRLLGQSNSFSSSLSESSFGSTITTTQPYPKHRKFVHPEVLADKRRARRRRTAALVCLGIMAITLVALAVGVVLHFLLETGILGPKAGPTLLHPNSLQHNVPAPTLPPSADQVESSI